MKNSKRTNYLLIVLALIFNLNTVFAQAPNWTWAKSAGGALLDKSQSLATDAQGNSYMTGSFESSSITFGGVTLQNTGLSDVFVVKSDPSGNVIWAKSLVGSSVDQSTAITADGSGNVYITGYYLGPTLTAGSITLTLIAGVNGGQNAFIVKLDQLGNVIWANNIGGPQGYESGRSLATDINNNVYLTGSFGDSITFGNILLTNPNGGQDFFITKYNSSGIVQWAKKADGTRYEVSSHIVVDANGNSYVAGLYNCPTLTFENIVLTNANNFYGGDIYIVKYDPMGNVVWVKTIGNTHDDGATGIALDHNGNLYISGYFYSDYLWFNGALLTNSNNGYSDSFIARYDTAGNIVWANKPLCFDNDGANSIAVDANSNPYITGSFYSSMTIGTIPLGGSAGGRDIYLAKYNSSGNVIWAKSAGGTNTDNCSAIKIDATGNLLATGYFRSPSIAFGTTTLINSSVGSDDIFLAKQDTCITPSYQGAITGNSVVCSGSVQTYSVVSKPGVYSYTWTLPSGWTGTSTINSISVIIGNVSGNISVTPNGNCTNTIGPSSNLAVTVDVLTTPTAISVSGGIAKVCPGDTRTYSTSLMSGVTYNWTVPIGAIINSGQGTRSINVTYNNNFLANGIISVTKVGICGVSAPRNLNIVRNVPLNPSAITGKNYGLCGATNEIYSVTNVSGMTYNWIVPIGATIINGQGTNSININFPSSNFTGIISVTANNACGPGAARKLTVRALPATPTIIYGNTIVCLNSVSNAYAIAPIATAVNYTWTGPTGSHITANGVTSTNNILVTTATSVSIDFGTVTSTSTVKVKATNACASGGTRSLRLTPCIPRLASTASVFNATVYPNPTNGWVKLVMNPESEIKLEIVVSDVLGKIVMKENVNLSAGYIEHPMNLEQLTEGIYFLTLQSAQGKQVIRISKE